MILAFAVLAVLAGVPELPAATAIARFPAEEARQGVAVDARYFYPNSNNKIGKYDKRTGVRVATWEGPRALYPHMNSCVVDKAELVCAASNYPAVPMASAVEIFDTRTLRHLRTMTLPPLPGSLTWIERHGADWYAALAIAPMSSSGGIWGDDGLLYVTGHDRGELYALRLPEAGTTLEHVATIALATGGQAIAWDRSQPRVIWSLDRETKMVVASRIPVVGVARR